MEATVCSLDGWPKQNATLLLFSALSSGSLLNDLHLQQLPDRYPPDLFLFTAAKDYGHKLYITKENK